MPLHRVKEDQLDTLIARVEHSGQIVTQVLTDPATVDGYIVVTRESINDTGDAWLPSSAKETR